MVRPRILVTRPLPEDLHERLAQVGELTLRETADPPTRAELLPLLSGHDFCVCQLTDPMDRAVLSAAARHPERPLRLLAQIAVGLDNIDIQAAAELGITLSHTPGVLTDATADLCMGLLLATCRRIVEADTYLRAGRWRTWSLDVLMGMELRGATLGILGMGRIGVAVARRARAFGMKIRYFSRRPLAPEIARELDARALALGRLLREADVLSVHLPLSEETRGLLDRRALFSMKEGAVLINTARGSIVDEQALVEALEDGPIARAGLDVFEREPQVHLGLLDRDDVVLLPHIGSATERTRHRMASMAVEAVEAAARGLPIPHRFVGCVKAPRSQC